MKTASTSISGLSLRPPYHVMISTGQHDLAVEGTTHRLFGTRSGRKVFVLLGSGTASSPAGREPAAGFGGLRRKCLSGGGEERALAEIRPKPGADRSS